ncbi:MAG: hypothetical protein L6R38_009026, partial [Xanthoria sp. 2 TBL-2021]
MSKTPPTDHDTSITALDGLTANQPSPNNDSVYFTASDGRVPMPETQQRTNTARIAHAPSTKDPQSNHSHSDDTNSLKAHVHASSIDANSVDITTSNTVDPTTSNIGVPIAETQQLITNASSAHTPSTQDSLSSDTYCNHTDDLTAPLQTRQNSLHRRTENMRPRSPCQLNPEDKYDSTDDEE